MMLKYELNGRKIVWVFRYIERDDVSTVQVVEASNQTPPRILEVGDDPDWDFTRRTIDPWHILPVYMEEHKGSVIDRNVVLYNRTGFGVIRY